MSASSITESNPILLSGPPWRPDTVSPGTFSRFILPFAYEAHGGLSATSIRTGPHFVEATSADWLHGLKGAISDLGDPSDMQRRDYFTRETALTLHQRARWLVLRREANKLETRRMTLPESLGGSVDIVMRTPGMVLFEWAGDEVRTALQIGFLIVEAFFAEGTKPRLSHLLAFNELYRYWRRPFESHSRRTAAGGPPEWKNYREVLGDFLGPNESSEVLALYLSRWSQWLRLPVEIDGKLWHLIQDESLNAANEHAEGRTNRRGWAFYSDNRAYVWTCAILREDPGSVSESLAAKIPTFDDMTTRPRCGAWVKLLNVDPTEAEPGKQENCTAFEADWAGDRTYRRWANEGAVYGFSYHAGAMLTTTPPLLLPTWRHFRELHFDQALLLLYVRCALFRFSEALALDSDHASRQTRENRALFVEKFGDLRWQFTIFTNLYQFPLLSNQQQAVETYALLRKAMDVQELYDEVKSEIENTHEFLAGWQQHEIGKNTFALTIYATAGLLVGLVFSLFQAYVTQPSPSLLEWLGALLLALLVCVLAVALVLAAGPLYYRFQRLQSSMSSRRDRARKSILAQFDSWL